MNEKPEGGPKPFKINPSADPLVQPKPRSISVPKPEPAKERVIAPSITSFTPARAHVNPAPIKPAPKPAESAAPATTSTPEPTKAPAPKEPATLVENTAPVENAPVANAPVKKGFNKKTIIGAIIALIILAVGIVGAVIVTTVISSTDPVSAAAIKLLSGDRPRYIQFDGKIKDSSIENDSFAGSTISNLKTKVDTETNLVEVTADALATADSSDPFKITMILDKENSYMNIGSTEGYFNTFIDAYTKSSEFDLEGVEIDLFNELIGSAVSTMSNTLDSTWVKLSVADLSEASAITGENPLPTCWVRAISTMPRLGKDAKALYEKNPFISYTTDNLGITQKNNQLYRLSFNNEKLAGFINSLTDNTSAKELLTCAGAELTGNITSADIIKILPPVVELYVEIDKNGNFTRVYFKYVSDDSAEIEADLEISYPDSAPITVPTETITMEELGALFAEAITSAFQTETEPEYNNNIIDYGDYYVEDTYEDDSDDDDYFYYTDPGQNIDNSVVNPEFDIGD